jgi:hypothetical protein
MPTRKKKSPSSSTRGPGRPRTRPTSSVTDSRSNNSTVSDQRPIWSFLRENRLGRILLVIICVSCVILLNFILSFNRFEQFFLFLGVELIVVVLVCWIRFVFRKNNDTKE